MYFRPTGSWVAMPTPYNADGSVDFGLTGWDIYSERGGQNGTMITLLEDLGVEAGLSKHVSFDMCRWTSALDRWEAERWVPCASATSIGNQRLVVMPCQTTASASALSPAAMMDWLSVRDTLSAPAPGPT